MILFIFVLLGLQPCISFILYEIIHLYELELVYLKSYKFIKKSIYKLDAEEIKKLKEHIESFNNKQDLLGNNIHIDNLGVMKINRDIKTKVVRVPQCVKCIVLEYSDVDVIDISGAGDIIIINALDSSSEHMPRINSQRNVAYANEVYRSTALEKIVYELYTYITLKYIGGKRR